jgi:hypothetical protein
MVDRDARHRIPADISRRSAAVATSCSTVTVITSARTLNRRKTARGRITETFRADEQPVCGRSHGVEPADNLKRRQRDVGLDHVERRVAADLLEAEGIAAVDEVAPGERVTGMRTAAADLQRSDVTGHADWSEGGPELDEPGPQVGPG